MEVNYKNNRLRKKLSSASQIKRNYGVNAKRVSQRLAEIEASDNLSILTSIPAANCHPLTGNRRGQWAVDISANYRLIFEIVNDPIPLINKNEINLKLVSKIRLVEIEDYH